MALNSISDLLQGIKRIYVGLQGVKSDGTTMEKIKTNDAGAMKVSAELTGSIKGYNGSVAEDWRSNTQGTLLASAARTNSIVSPQQTNYNARGVQITLNVTAASGTGGLTVIIRGYDPVASSQYTINALPTSITTTGVYVYEIYPGSSGAAASAIAQRTAGILPRTWSVTMSAGDASSYTYSIGYVLIV